MKRPITLLIGISVICLGLSLPYLSTLQIQDHVVDVDYPDSAPVGMKITIVVWIRNHAPEKEHWFIIFLVDTDTNQSLGKVSILIQPSKRAAWGFYPVMPDRDFNIQVTVCVGELRDSEVIPLGVIEEQNITIEVGEAVGGWIDGTILDAETAEPLTGATVTAVEIVSGNTFSASSGTEGYYQIELIPGTYNVTAEKTGYYSETKLGIKVSKGSTTTVENIGLEPGAPIEEEEWSWLPLQLAFVCVGALLIVKSRIKKKVTM
ncbi:MAG: carboxypeptidase regulatory-like domain-containing protein [Desulfobacterales bacterium]|nr:carboxypeptidase regulatory-like domain-containing protein [Desulfobacterales bacterium]